MARIQKLCQVIALVSGKKAVAKKTLEEAYHAFQKPDLFSGMTRVFTARIEGEANRPPERKNPQQSVVDMVGNVRRDLTDLFDTVATQDRANTEAKADVIIDGMSVLKDVPVTTLMFLEKQATDLATLIGKLPLRDGAEDWTFQKETGSYVTETRKTLVTSKVAEVLVMYPATTEHPAQTQLVHKDIVVGNWDVRNFSTAVTKTEQDAMQFRVRKLLDALAVAREEANLSAAAPVKIGENILKYVFDGNTAV